MTARTTFAAALLTECLVPIGLCRHLLGRNRGAGRTPKRVVELVGDMSSGSAAVCLAECAVDDDFSQSGLEDGEFVIVEPLDE